MWAKARAAAQKKLFRPQNCFLPDSRFTNIVPKKSSVHYDELVSTYLFLSVYGKIQMFLYVKTFVEFHTHVLFCIVASFSFFLLCLLCHIAPLLPCHSFPPKISSSPPPLFKGVKITGAKTGKRTHVKKVRKGESVCVCRYKRNVKFAKM